MAKRINYFNNMNSSTAYKPEVYDDYHERRAEEYFNEYEKNRRMFRRKRNITVYAVKKDGLRISPLAVLTIIMAFAVFFIMLNVNVRIYEKQASVITLRAEKKKLLEENENIKAEISAGMDLVEIERRAVTKLGMSAPKSYQIIHVNVPKASYISTYLTAETEEPKNDILSVFARMIKGL